MIEEPNEQRNISACVEVLARLKFDQNLIRQFLREELMRESPLYQEILQEGVQQRIQQKEVTLTLRQLTRRLGTVSPQLQTQIQQLSRNQVEALGEALLDFSSTQDLVAWLQNHQ